MEVVFVGAGPGDPELLTIRGKQEIETADVLIYAGSLVNKELLGYANKAAIRLDSSKMKRTEIFRAFETFINEGKKVVRLHCGDLSFYSTLQEQIDFLRQKKIPFRIVPGVTSFAAVSAALQRELTSPGVSQTLIITKPLGRTGKPSRETIQALSQHQATMAIFLGADLIDEIVAELKAGYPEDTPIAVVHKASWGKDETIILGTLENIADKMKVSGIKNHALIIVGKVLDDSGLSMLYGDES